MARADKKKQFIDVGKIVAKSMWIVCLWEKYLQTPAMH